MPSSSSRSLRSSRGLCLFFLVALGAPAAARERTITFLHIADTHAQLETHAEYMPGETPELDQMGGYARLKTALDRERARTPNAVFSADSGDTFQGSGPAAWSRGEVVLAPLNALGLDVCVPGNWEPVYGAERFVDLYHRLACKVVTYNLHYTKTGERLFAPSVILERGGVKVAFVGITDPTTTKRQPPDQVRGLDSTRMEGLRDYVKRLRSEQHPDLVVVVDHTGLTVSRQLAREIPELDVILSGHTHERTWHSITEGKVIVVEPGSMGSFLGRLDVTLDDAGHVSGHTFKLIPVRASSYPEDPAVKALVDRNLAPYRARSQKVVGRTQTPVLRYDVLETNADNLIADAVKEGTHAELATTNGFRFTPPILAGELTEGDMWSLLPLDAHVKMGWVTGRELRAYLELELVFASDPWKLSGGWGPRIAGMVLTFAAYDPEGKRLRSVSIGGKPMNDDRHYTFAGCERAGEPLDVVCRMVGVHDVKILPLGVHEMLDAYLQRHPIISPVRDGRARATDLPPHVFSQDAVLAHQKNP